MLTQWEAFEPSPPPLRVRGAGEQGPEPALRGFGGRGWNVSPRSAVTGWLTVDGLLGHPMRAGTVL